MNICDHRDKVMVNCGNIHVYIHILHTIKVMADERQHTDTVIVTTYMYLHIADVFASCTTFHVLLYSSNCLTTTTTTTTGSVPNYTIFVGTPLFLFSESLTNCCCGIIKFPVSCRKLVLFEYDMLQAGKFESMVCVNHDTKFFASFLKLVYSWYDIIYVKDFTLKSSF